MIGGRKKAAKIKVACGSCGHTQWEYAETPFSFCRACGAKIHIKNAEEKPREKRKLNVQRRELGCFHCGHIMQVPTSALSWQCPSCSSYLDLRDYSLSGNEKKTIETYGELQIASHGSFTGVLAKVAAARIAGRVSGKILCRGTMVLEQRAVLENSVEAMRLEVASGAHCRINKPARAQTVEVSGHLRCKELTASQVVVKSGGVLQVDQLTVESVRVEVGGSLRASARVAPSLAGDTAASVPQEEQDA